MKKILVISSSMFLADFLTTKLEKLSIEIISANDALDGLIKMRNILPDLLIMDFDTKKITINQFLNDKQDLKTTCDIPIILLYSKKDKVDKNIAKKLARTKIYKLFLKPFEADNLINSVSEFFNANIDIDSQPSHIDINLNNNNLLFIQVSQGLNKEKIILMKYKILKYKNQNNFKLNKIMIVLSDINKSKNINELLDLFIYKIIFSTESDYSNITLLTSDKYIKKYFQNNSRYSDMYISDNYKKALEKLESNNDLSMTKDPSSINKIIKNNNSKNEVFSKLNFASDKKDNIEKTEEEYTNNKLDTLFN